VEKQERAHVSLSKQLGILVSTLNAVVKNCKLLRKMQISTGQKQKYINKSMIEELEDVLKKCLKMLSHPVSQ
jgi:hypothetical protein